jgi:hypothetical protein
MMLDFSKLLKSQPRAVVIETIYLVSHELTPALPSPLEANIKSIALSEAESKVARKTAYVIIERLEKEHKKPLAEFSAMERSRLIDKLYGYLARLTQHGPSVKRAAAVALEDFAVYAI